MKTVAILLTIVVAVCYGSEDECVGDSLKPIVGKCLEEHGGDKVHYQDFVGLKESRDENGKCFRACIFTKCNYLDDAGKFKGDTAARLSQVLNGGDETKTKDIEEAAMKCLEVQEYEENMCNNGENFVKCIVSMCESCALKLYKPTN